MKSRNGLTDRAWLGRRVGGSTGTNLWAGARLAQEMQEAGQTASVVTLLCDGGERYGSTYYDDAWLAERGIDWHAPHARMAALFDPPSPSKP